MNHLKTGDTLNGIESVSNSYSTSGTYRVIVQRQEHCVIWKLCWTPVCVKAPFYGVKNSTQDNVDMKAEND